MHLNLPRLVRELLHDDVLPLVARNAEKKDDTVSTSVSYVFKTASKTFSGSAMYITIGLPSSTDDSQPTTTSHHHHSSTQDSQTTPTVSTKSQSQTTSSSKTTPTALLTANSLSSTPTAFDTTSQITSAASLTTSTSAGSFDTGSATSSSLDPALAAGGSSSTSSATPSASAKADSGMSSGAKAGLAIAIIFILAAIVGAVAFVYRKKKREQEAGQRLDDEKGAMNHHNQANDFLMTAGAAAPAMHSESKKAPSVAPRLSLRPVTQLFGFNNPNRKSAANPLDLATGPGPTMAGAAGAHSGTSSPRGLRSAGQTAAIGGGAGPQSASAWEKMGEREHASDPNNPFGDHARSLNASPPSNAIPDVPDSPTKTDSLAIATGAAGGVLAAGAAASRSEQTAPQQTSIVPKPLSIKSSRSLADGPISPMSSGPASPTKTESSEVPASSVAGGAAAVAAPAGAPGPGGPNNVHRVQMDFKPSMDDELELRAGQLVRMLHAYDDGWALCVRMDRSAQGVVPRTCLSTHPVKPRPPPNAQGPRGPPAGSPRNGPPGAAPRGLPPMGPPGGRNSPGPYGPPGRAMTPNGRNSPGPFQGRPMTPSGRNSPGPHGMSPMGPFGNQPRPGSPGMRGPPGPGGRARSGSVPRSMSPGPYGSGGRPQMGSGDSRRRSNSMGQLMNAAPGSRRNSPPGLSPLGQGQSNFSRPQRKPVPQTQ